MLSSGYHESGLLTFTLTAPNGSVVDTQTITPSGDGTYNTSNTAVATQAGIYTWSVNYAGDALKNNGDARSGRHSAGRVKTFKAGDPTALADAAPGGVLTMELLTDGTVMAVSGGVLYKLTPDATGSYVNGTWSQIASPILQSLADATKEGAARGNGRKARALRPQERARASTTIRRTVRSGCGPALPTCKQRSSIQTRSTSRSSSTGSWASRRSKSARCVEEGVITDMREADVGSILGFGFAPFTGGTISYIDRMGAKAFVDMCNGLAKRYGSRFKPPKILRDMAKTGETFYGRFPPEKRKAVA